jgi:hypothetical protein
MEFLVEVQPPQRRAWNQQIPGTACANLFDVCNRCGAVGWMVSGIRRH